MKTKPSIMISGGILDFYVNKAHFEAYKTNKGRLQFVRRTLDKYFSLIIGTIVNNIEIRDISITPNNFWGIDELCLINDLGYSGTNKVPMANNKNLTIRMFEFDIVGISENKPETKDLFFDIENDNFLLTLCSTKIV